MLDRLAPGDVVTVTRIDRLALDLRPVRYPSAYRTVLYEADLIILVTSASSRRQNLSLETTPQWHAA
jgi:hypothetical protein